VLAQARSSEVRSAGAALAEGLLSGRTHDRKVSAIDLVEPKQGDKLLRQIPVPFDGHQISCHVAPCSIRLTASAFAGRGRKD
jgi:hypothetical protein